MAQDRLTEAEVAERADTSVERIRHLVDLGILERDQGSFARREVMRARVVADLERKQVPVGEEVTRIVEPRWFEFEDFGRFALKGISEPRGSTKRGRRRDES